MNRPSQWNDAVYTLIVKAMARVGWWLQRPLIKLQRESMTTVDAFNDADDQEIDAFIGEIRERKSYLGAGEEVRTSRLAPEDFDSPVSQPCAHEHVSAPKYSGGNYGYYGYVRCLDCGAWKDDYSDWHTAHDVFDQHVRTLDTSTDEIKKWPTIRPSQWTDEQTEHVESITRGIRPEILKPNVHERLEQWRTGQIELRGTEPQWYQDAFKQWQWRREQRERLEQPHMGDELSDEEVNEYLEHGNLPNEAERLRELRRRENMRELLMQVSEQPSTTSIMARLEQARLEQASTMPPEAPQEPVSAAEPEDEWKCLYCGKHVDRAAKEARYVRQYNGAFYVTTQAWCDASCYTLWQHGDVANDAR